MTDRIAKVTLMSAGLFLGAASLVEAQAAQNCAPRDQVVERLATAEGRLGSCRDYLMKTVSCLAEHGFRDRRMHYLHRQVQQFLEAARHEREDE